MKRHYPVDDIRLSAHSVILFGWILASCVQLSYAASDSADVPLPTYLEEMRSEKISSSDLASRVQRSLNSQEHATRKEAFVLSRRAGRRLAGSSVVAQLEECFSKTADYDTRYQAVRSLCAICDPKSRPFFRRVVKMASEPATIRLWAANYLIADMELRRDEVDSVMRAFLDALDAAERIEPSRTDPSLDADWIWIHLNNLVDRYGMPQIADIKLPRTDRIKEASHWWDKNRDLIVGKIPKGARLLKIGLPQPRAVYDWDEGLAMLSSRIQSSDEEQIRQGILLVHEAGEQLRGTPIVAQLEQLYDKYEQSGDENSNRGCREIMLAMMSIGDGASRGWFIRHLEPSYDLMLRSLAANYLSKELEADAASGVIDVIKDWMVLEAQPKRGIPLKEVRHFTLSLLQNIAKGKNAEIPALDWEEGAGRSRLIAIEEWWCDNRAKLVAGLLGCDEQD